MKVSLLNMKAAVKRRLVSTKDGWISKDVFARQGECVLEIAFQNFLDGKNHNVRENPTQNL